MKIIIRATIERIEMIERLSFQLQYPNVVFCMDEKKNAMDTFLKAMRIAEEGPSVHMEEDIMITSNFYEKLNSVISERKNEVIQFFSMRGKDLTIGSRYEHGRTFMMNQCFYLPEGYSKMILEYYPSWGQKEKHPTGYDILIADFLRERKEKYWIHCPSLVQHIECVSLIDKRRSRNRQSKSFIP